MSSRRRDRHDRGIRGPLALDTVWSRHRARPPQPSSRAEFFGDAVSAAVERIHRQCPDALAGVTIGVEDVPAFDPSTYLDPASLSGRVPLALAAEATAETPRQVVVYRRPLEHRAVTRRGLRILVYRTIVEQLSALTGRSVTEIDPDGAGAMDEDG